jgi:uncharacterized protein YciI
MLFAIIRHDKPDSFDLRRAVRPDHLIYLESVMHCIAFGGALLNEHGQQTGSVLFVDVADRAAAEMFAATDPFVAAGLFAVTTIAPFRHVFSDGARVDALAPVPGSAR